MKLPPQLPHIEFLGCTPVLMANYCPPYPFLSFSPAKPEIHLLHLPGSGEWMAGQTFVGGKPEQVEGLQNIYTHKNYRALSLCVSVCVCVDREHFHASS